MSTHTTVAILQHLLSSDFGAILQFGDYIFVIDRLGTGGYTADIYKLIDDPIVYGDLGPCEVAFFKGYDYDTFLDSGHAVDWCISQVK